jgi:hypothetical protein
MLADTGFKVESSRGFGFFAYALAGFPDKLDALRWVPAAERVTRILLSIDSVLESFPFVGEMALHWQVRARKID